MKKRITEADVERAIREAFAVVLERWDRGLQND